MSWLSPAFSDDRDGLGKWRSASPRDARVAERNAGVTREGCESEPGVHHTMPRWLRGLSVLAYFVQTVCKIFLI